MAVDVTPVSFMIVVKTTQGNGIACSMIDAAEMPEVIGTLAGHNTIYVTTPTAEAQLL